MLNQQNEKTKQESSMAQIQSQEKLAHENREDLQAHEKELKEMDIESKMELEKIKLGGKGMLDSQNNTQKAMSDNAQAQGNTDDIFSK
jgi:hypothetical protein